MSPKDDDFDFDKNINPLLHEPEAPRHVPDKKEEEEEKKEEEDIKKELEDEFSFGEEEEEEKKKEESKKEEKKKPSKEDSIATLRAQRDEAREQIKQLRESIGDLEPSIAKRFTELLKKNFEDDLLTEEGVEQFVDTITAQKDQIADLENKLKEQGKLIQDLDIRSSPDFQNEYVRPVQDAAAELQVEISNLDEKGKVKAPKATEAFHRFLMSKEDLKATDVKSALAKFSSDYSSETGEDYMAPSVSSVMTAYNKFHRASGSMREAYEGWAHKKKETSDKQRAEYLQQQEAVAKENKRLRYAAAQKALREFDGLGPFDKKRVQTEFREAFRESESYFDDPTKNPDYDVLMGRMVKARLYDELIEKHQEILNRLKEFEEEDKDRSKGKGTSSIEHKEQDKDWMPTGILD